MHLTDLFAPLAAGWLRQVQADLDLVPHPTDAPRQVAAGLNADRVLLLGNGPVIGFGVRSQELALPGHLARALQRATGRGATVDVVSQRGLLVEHPDELLRRCRPDAYDAVVLSVGVTDAAGLLPVRRWRAGFSALLDTLRTRVAPATTIAVLPTRPVQRVDGAERRIRHVAERQARRFDRATAEMCGATPGVVFLPADETADPPRTAAAYAEIARRTAALLAPRLDAIAEPVLGDTARARRRAPDPEGLRQAALDRTGLVGRRDPNPAVDRLLQAALDLLGGRAAAVSLVDGDRVAFRATAGMPEQDVARATAPCDRAIRQDGPFILGDLRGEPIAADGWRFYAGHPLESPDGLRIGTLCVLDTVAHPEGQVNRVALIELAARMQAELWTEIGAATSGTGGSGLTRPVLSALPA